MRTKLLALLLPILLLCGCQVVPVNNGLRSQEATAVPLVSYLYQSDTLVWFVNYTSPGAGVIEEAWITPAGFLTPAKVNHVETNFTATQDAQGNIILTTDRIRFQPCSLVGQTFHLRYYDDNGYLDDLLLSPATTDQYNAALSQLYAAATAGS